MVASVCKAILKRSVEYQRRGLRVLRHAVTLVLGLGLASTILYISGDNPFAPTIAVAVVEELEQAADTVAQVAALTNRVNVLAMLNSILGGAIVAVLGIVLTLFVWLANYVASYDVVINTPNVILAWRVLRDLVNLFFVIILLIIAIGTTLRREQYMWNKNLPRFIIAVIFVNFSRTIVAFVTDFADVIQQTFVAGIDSVGFSTFISMLGVVFYPTISTVQDFSTLPDPGQVLASLALVAIMELIVMAIMFVYIVMFVGRVVMLWLLAIFGPLAFVSSILPQTQKYYKDWWSKLSQAAILGPMLAFFMWLAITIVPSPAEASFAFGVFSGAPPQFGTAAQPSFVIGWLIAVIILYFGMQQGMGMAGDFGSFVGKAQSFAFGTVLGGIGSAAAFAGKDVLGRLDYVQMKTRQALGRGIQTQFKGSKFAQTAGALIGAGGTFGNLRQAFVERQQEGAKRRAEAGLEANKAVATTVGTWPVLKAVDLIQGKTSALGAVQTTAGSAGLKVTDIMQGSSASVEARQERATVELDNAENRAKDELAKGNISQDDFNKSMMLINEHRQFVNVEDWEGAGRLERVQTTITAGRTRMAEIDEIIRGFEEAIGDINRQIAEQQAIELNPASTPAEVTAAQNRQAELIAERDPLEQRKTAFEAQRTAVELSVNTYEPMLTRMKGEREEWYKTATRPAADELRGKSSDLIAQGNRNLAGGALGPVLVNLGQEYGTQKYLDQKARWDSSVKEAERQTGFDPDNSADYLAKGLAAANPDKVQAALMVGAKTGKLRNILTSARMQPEVEKLYREDLTKKGYKPAQIEDYIKDLRRAPGSQENIIKAQQLILKKVYGDNEAAVSTVAGNIREADHESSGAAPAMTYTDSATGATRLIEVKEKLEQGKIKLEFDPKALDALNSELKGMKPPEFMYNLKKGNLFKLDADGNVQGIAALMKNYMKSLPGNFAAHVKSLNAGMIGAIKENQSMLEEEIRNNPSAKEWQNMGRLLHEMSEKQMLN